MPKLSDLQSLVEAASSIAAGNVFWGAVDIITTIAGYVPWGKVWKSIGELVKAVGPLRKFYLAIDKYGSAGMAKLRNYLNEKRGRATYEDGKVKISNPDGPKIDAEDVVKGISNYSKVLESASVPYKGTTILGHALSKHSMRNPNIWGKLSGNPATWHNQALKHFDDIMNAKGEFIKIPNEYGINFLEKKLLDGRGIRLNLDWTFKGFID